MSASPRPSSRLWPFALLACALTWTLAAPAAFAWWRRAPLPPIAMPAAGLSAFGPLLAAWLVTRRTERREVFGRWRAPLGFVLLALATPALLHLVATVGLVALGGQPDQWLHPPSTRERVAALVVFPIGEELGWRGFAHPRLAARFGVVRGSLLLGLLWAVWHLAYGVTPAGTFDAFGFAYGAIELPLYGLILAWFFERTGRSLAVAVAFHAGAHLDRLESAPRTDLRIHAIHLAVVAALALLAARELARRASARPEGVA